MEEKVAKKMRYISKEAEKGITKKDCFYKRFKNVKSYKNIKLMKNFNMIKSFSQKIQKFAFGRFDFISNNYRRSFDDSKETMLIVL